MRYKSKITYIVRRILCMVLLLSMLVTSNMEVMAASGSLVAFYDFAGTLANKASGSVSYELTVSNTTRSYGTDSALTDPTYYQWSGAGAPGFGMKLTVAKNISSTYSIAMRFSYTSAVTGYRKIIDYSNFGLDTGFYLLNGKLVYYYSGVKATGVTTFSNNQIIDLVVTRNSSNIFTVYSVVNGVFQKEFEYEDTGGSAKGYLSGSSTIFGFFRDDNGGSEYSSGGKAYSIKIWDYALSEAEARAAAEPISVTYKNSDGTTIKTISYAPGNTVTVDACSTTDEFRGWQGSDGNIYQAGSTFSIQTATTLTAITVPNAPTWESESGNYYVYGNGYPISIRANGTGTAVYWDSDNDGSRDDLVTANGTSGGTTALFNADQAQKLYLYGGGKKDTMSNRDAAVFFESGKAKELLGCGRMSTSTIRNTYIYLQGGTVEMVNACDSTSKASGNKIVYVMGSPIVTGSLKLSATTNGYAIINGYLNDAAAISVSSPKATADGTVIAHATDAVYARAEVFHYSGNGLTVNAGDIVIKNHYVVTLDQQGATSAGSTSVSAIYGSGMPTINKPERSGYLFAGYYSETDGAGTAYYDASGAGAAAWDRTEDTTLYAKWLLEDYTITYQGMENVQESDNPSGYSIETETFTLKNPIRDGYSFTGWSGTDLTGTENQNVTIQKGSIGNKIYTANWSVHSSTLHINLDTGSWPQNADSTVAGKTSFTQDYQTSIALPTPQKEGYIFGGWSMTEGDNGSYEVITGGIRYTFGADTTPVTLTAIWRENTSVAIIDESSIGVKAEQLENIFHYTDSVTETDKGVTSEDIAAGSVSLELIVTDKNEQASGGLEIVEAAQGAVPYFFDVTVKKMVTPEGNENGTETVLKELPTSIKIIMDMTGTDLEGRSFYQVYRYHDDQVQKLSMQSVDGEFYTIDGSIITIYTRRFSTYAVVAGVSSVTTEQFNAGSGHTAVDVQGRIIDEYQTPVYKVDIAWGAMKFEYGAGISDWDPEKHSYVQSEKADTEQRDTGWMPDGFTGGNNEIIIKNHSNADLLVNYNIGSSFIDGVTMEVLQDNIAGAAPASEVFLTKVPEEGAQEPALQSYLWLSGAPTDITSMSSDSYEKIGSIVITLKAQQGALTPKSIE